MLHIISLLSVNSAILVDLRFAVIIGILLVLARMHGQEVRRHTSGNRKASLDDTLVEGKYIEIKFGFDE